MGKQWTVNSDHSLACLKAHLDQLYTDKKFITVTLSTGQQRTLTQNAALHKFCALLADKLNEAGLDMRQVLKPEIEIPWTPASTKEHLWRPIQQSQFVKQSTTELNRQEVSEVYETLMRHLSQKFGLYVPFPSQESQEQDA